MIANEQELRELCAEHIAMAETHDGCEAHRPCEAGARSALARRFLSILDQPAVGTRSVPDPRQWRAGDMFDGFFEGHRFSGALRADVWGNLLVGTSLIYDRNDGLREGLTGLVTRPVAVIEEPTELGAGIRHESGMTCRRWVEARGGCVWMDEAGAIWTWEQVVARYGHPVAVSRPRWVDADGVAA